jgi:methylmalonyl-CoA mutase
LVALPAVGGSSCRLSMLSLGTRREVPRITDRTFRTIVTLLRRYDGGDIGHLGAAARGPDTYDRAMPGQHLPLATDFPAPSREQWRALVADVLTKAGGPPSDDVEAALRSLTYDGIAIDALYTRADARPVDSGGLPGAAPFLRGATADGSTVDGWDVRTLHEQGDAASVNDAARNDLEAGATSLWLVLGGSGRLAVADLPRALDGVYLDLAPVVLDAGADTLAAAEALLALAADRGVDPGELRGSFGADPIGDRARRGEQAPIDLFPRLREVTAPAPAMRIATVDASVYHDAGASDAHELGIATAVGVEYLRELTEAGWTVEDAVQAVEFRWTVTAEQFPSIAKLRAARRLWHRVAELCGVPERGRGQWQHAVTSRAMLTRRDPWVNMLRTTIGCFAAAVGGADAITVLPFDAAIGVSDDFARRIARNTSAILHDESSLARVIDAAGGSWFVESMTDALAEKAWDVFTGIERAGGAGRAVHDGVIGELIAAVRERRAADIAHRRVPITGVSEYAFVAEQPVVRPPAPAADAGLLPRVRYAESFEQLRDRADAAPSRPTVFLAGLGPLAEHSARTSFAANLFQAGGIECPRGRGDVAELVAAFRHSGAAIACLCGTDSRYAGDGAEVAAALRDAGAVQVWVAGRADVPAVDGSVYAGCDAVAVLGTVLDATEPAGAA